MAGNIPASYHYRERHTILVFWSIINQIYTMNFSEGTTKYQALLKNQMAKIYTHKSHQEINIY